MSAPVQRTRVVNVASGEAFDVYVGRAAPRCGLKASPFANPFRIGRDGDRGEVIARYRAWLAERPELLAQVRGLRGLRLACWCAPEACHAGVLAELADGSDGDG